MSQINSLLEYEEITVSPMGRPLPVTLKTGFGRTNVQWQPVADVGGTTANASDCCGSVFSSDTECCNSMGTTANNTDCCGSVFSTDTECCNSMGTSANNTDCCGSVFSTDTECCAC